MLLINLVYCKKIILVYSFLNKITDIYYLLLSLTKLNKKKKGYRHDVPIR